MHFSWNHAYYSSGKCLPNVRMVDCKGHYSFIGYVWGKFIMITGSQPVVRLQRVQNYFYLTTFVQNVVSAYRVVWKLVRTVNCSEITTDSFELPLQVISSFMLICWWITKLFISIYLFSWISLHQIIIKNLGELKRVKAGQYFRPAIPYNFYFLQFTVRFINIQIGIIIIYSSWIIVCRGCRSISVGKLPPFLAEIWKWWFLHLEYSSSICWRFCLYIQGILSTSNEFQKHDATSDVYEKIYTSEIAYSFKSCYYNYSDLHCKHV